MNQQTYLSMPHIVQKRINEHLDKIANEVNAQVAKYGFYKSGIGIISKSDFITISYSLGEVISPGRDAALVTEIYTDDKKGEKFVPLHNDKCYWRIPPKYMLFYFQDVKNIEGGETTISNLQQSFEELNEADRHELIQTQVRIKTPHNRDAGEMIALLVNQINTSNRFFRMRLDLFSMTNRAIFNWYQKISQNTQTIKLQKGDLFILDNWVFAHGRNETNFTNGGFRNIYRALVI